MGDEAIELAPPDFIEIPGGVFVMGGGLRPEENPAHEVELPPFRLARTPVTREQYGAFLDATGHPAPVFWRQPELSQPRLPAVGPSWDDALAFCDWASEAWGLAVRLPSEAEWERAAKGGREVLYAWGDDPPESLPDYPQRWLHGPEPVDAYPCHHPWGFLGLGENVHEWCSDWYAVDYYRDSPRFDPRGPEHGRRRASRGGAWRHAIKVSRCTARSSIPPHSRYADYGFRLAAPPSTS